MTEEDDVRAILGGLREAKLYRAICTAWQDLQQDRPRYSIWPRTRANMMFERIAVRLQELFADDAGVHFVFADETIKIIFDDRLIVRCKKADDAGLGHNIPTMANDLFCTQASFLRPLGKIEVVYFIDEYATKIDEVVVQARDGDTRLWSYPIDDMAFAVSAPVISLPTPTAPAIASDAENLVHPRSKPIAKEESDEEE
jgi:hypothetical protein